MHVSVTTLGPRQRCLSCWSQDTDRLYLDFHSAIDGPVEDQGDVIGFVNHDDLIICEQCVHGAEAVLPDAETAIERLTAENLDLRNAVETWHAYALKIEAAVQSRPAPAKRKPGRPRKDEQHLQVAA